MTAPRFAPGMRVAVKGDWPETRGPVHIRTPHYVRGAWGRVERCLGAFANPEDLAFGRPATARPLYHVAFEATSLWPDASGQQVVVEIFEHWLEAAP